MRADVHVHTCFSCDSKTAMEDMCVSAIQKNLNVICFTDHVDHNPRDDGYEYYSAQAYFQEIERVRQKYGDRLNILSGMEFSEPHLYPSQFEEMKKLPYDFIIGSLHYWVDDLFPSEMVKKHIPLEECYAKYWAAMHRMVEYGGFDCVGHIDFPKRYYHSLQYEEENMRDLFRMIVRQRIVIEINTSSLRRGLTETMPNEALLRIYQEQGGKFVMTGSDAHCCEDLVSNLYEASQKAQAAGLSTVFFKNRKMQLEQS